MPLLIYGVSGSQVCHSRPLTVPDPSGKPLPPSCSASGLLGWPLQVLAILLILAPVAVALYLGLRIRKPQSV